MEQQVLSLLKDRVESGTTKTALEKLIGLPQNSLSKVMKGKAKLSKKGLQRCIEYFELNVETNEAENN